MTWEEIARSEMSRLRNLAIILVVASIFDVIVDNAWLRPFMVFMAGHLYVASVLEWKKVEKKE